MARSRKGHQPGRNNKSQMHKGPASDKDTTNQYKVDLVNLTNKWVGSAHVSVRGKPGLGNRRKRTGRITGGGF